MRIKVLGVLRSASRGAANSLCFAGEPTVKDVVLRLIEARPELRSALWDESEASPAPNALIMLGGVEVGNLEGLETKVPDGSEVVVLPVTHGG